MCLTLDQVCFAYPDGPTILQDASQTFKQGEYLLVRGPSGSGKSTLLRLLCRLEEVQDGTITFNGTPLSDISPAELRRSVAYVQQMPTLLTGTVRDNLLLPFSFKTNAGLSRPTDRILTDHLDSFLLTGITPDSNACKLSVGQAQRICLIRSLLLSPAVVLLDEPTASLDTKSATVVLDKTRELAKSNVTVIMISHSETVPEGVTNIVTVANKGLVLQ